MCTLVFQIESTVSMSCFSIQWRTKWLLYEVRDDENNDVPRKQQQQQQHVYDYLTDT